jgi:4-amino-4-deoxychorismate lyase
VEDPLLAGAGQPGLILIETLGWTGAEFPRITLHLSRLTRSAARLGWPCDALAAETALRHAAPTAPARLRLTLNSAGDIAVQSHPMPQPNAQWTLILSPIRLYSADPWLTLKSSHRVHYDTVRTSLPPGVDEAIFLNERNEVCDGTITTLFFDRGHGLCTPPLTCGLLPGVLRAELAVPEEILLARDLPHVRLWVGNSLRGLFPAVWQG